MTMPTNHKPVTLVAATPTATRVRSVSRDLTDSPDTLNLGSDDEEEESGPARKRRVFIPDTPIKR